MWVLTQFEGAGCCPLITLFHRLSGSSSLCKSISHLVETLHKAAGSIQLAHLKAVDCNEVVFLTLFSAVDYTLRSHEGQIPNWEIQTPEQLLSLPKAIFCHDTVAAAVRSVSLLLAVDVSGRHSGSLFSLQWDCHALNGLRRAADCVAQGRTQDCRIVKIAFSSPSLTFLLPGVQTYVQNFFSQGSVRAQS